MSEPTRILHAGLHKTGSTFLQKELFPNLQRCTYFHNFHLHKGPHLNCDSESKAILFSSEASCGLPYPVTPQFSTMRLITNVRTLGINKVFILRRSFPSWVLSMYIQSLKAGRCWHINEFIDLNREALLTWDEAPQRIAKALGELSIDFACFSQDELAINPHQTCADICSFIGVPTPKVNYRRVNSGLYGTLAIRYFRAVNRLGQYRFIRPAYRAMNIEPLKLMKARRGRMGYLLNQLSRRHLTPDDVSSLLNNND